jgi:hypothetical protein
LIDGGPARKFGHAAAEGWAATLAGMAKVEKSLVKEYSTDEHKRNGFEG